ncbi:MAG: zinc ribbon domain-containing protein [Bacillota bacterium]
MEERETGSQLKCQDCGEIVDLNTRFCANCGAKIVPDEQLRCDNCNTALEEGTNFCPECGTDIS